MFMGPVQSYLKIWYIFIMIIKKLKYIIATSFILFHWVIFCIIPLDFFKVQYTFFN